MKNNTNIQYRQVGDYNIPNLTLPPEEANITLGSRVQNIEARAREVVCSELIYS